MTAQPAIELHNVCKSFIEAGLSRSVLENINISFNSGKLIAIQGRSGSGKSTLLNLMAGLDLPDSGEIYTAGHALNRLSEQQRTLIRRKHMGFIFQSFNLIPTLTVSENLLFPLELNRIERREALSEVDSILEHFSLADRTGSYPDQLSGGEQQRVAIARGVIHRPQIVFADEPTGNLDLDTERTILEYIQRLPQEYAVTLVCVTHSAEIAAIADNIFVLEKGVLHPG